MNHLPMRGDAVEAWLTSARDGSGSYDRAWSTVDALLTEYLSFADNGEVMIVEDGKFMRPE